jgi:hypothetical protein
MLASFSTIRLNSGRLKPKLFPQRRWAGGAMQDEHRLARRSPDMNMRRSVIVWVNDHMKAIKTEHSRHCRFISEPKRFGK